MPDTDALTLAIQKSKGHHPNQSNMLFSQKKEKKKKWHVEGCAPVLCSATCNNESQHK